MILLALAGCAPVPELGTTVDLEVADPTACGHALPVAERYAAAGLVRLDAPAERYEVRSIGAWVVGDDGHEDDAGAWTCDTTVPIRVSVWTGDLAEAPALVDGRPTFPALATVTVQGTLSVGPPLQVEQVGGRLRPPLLVEDGSALWVGYEEVTEGEALACVLACDVDVQGWHLLGPEWAGEAEATPANLTAEVAF